MCKLAGREGSSEEEGISYAVLSRDEEILTSSCQTEEGGTLGEEATSDIQEEMRKDFGVL